jgi:hypothetical protein
VQFGSYRPFSPLPEEPATSVIRHSYILKMEAEGSSETVVLPTKLHGFTSQNTLIIFSSETFYSFDYSNLFLSTELKMVAHLYVGRPSWQLVFILWPYGYTASVLGVELSVVRIWSVVQPWTVSCLHKERPEWPTLQPADIYPNCIVTLKMEASYSSETLLSTYEAMWYHSPDDHSLSNT